MPRVTGARDERERKSHFPSRRVRVKREERKGDDGEQAGGGGSRGKQVYPRHSGPGEVGSVWRRRGHVSLRSAETSQRTGLSGGLARSELVSGGRGAGSGCPGGFPPAVQGPRVTSEV